MKTHIIIMSLILNIKSLSDTSKLKAMVNKENQRGQSKKEFDWLI